MREKERSVVVRGGRRGERSGRREGKGEAGKGVSEGSGRPGGAGGELESDAESPAHQLGVRSVRPSVCRTWEQILLVHRRKSGDHSQQERHELTKGGQTGM